MDGLVTNESNVHIGDRQLTHVVAGEEYRRRYSKSRTSSSVGAYGTKTVAPKQSLDFERLSSSIASELELPMPGRPFVLVMDYENLSAN